MKISVRTAMAVATCMVASLGAVSSASAGTPTGDYVDFKYCPYANPDITNCIYSKTTSGSFKLGNADVPITAATPVILQGGIYDDGSGDLTPLLPAVGADTLSKTKLKVPGGLVGLVDTGGLTGALISLLNAAIAAENDVYATAELAGTPQLSLNNLTSRSGTAVSLPVKIHLENPFLGSSCYIGSNSNPVRLNLTTGTTAPPAPNTPISGSPGTLSFNNDFTVIYDTNNKLVDNSFAAPAASNCGITFLDRLLVTPAVNLKEGLPAAAGKNTAILQGNTESGNSYFVNESAQ
jgi:hypothetical protein